MPNSKTIASINNNRSKRLIVFDLLRGLLLLNILINHIELYPSGYDLISGRGRMFVSAAEGFFFISGLLVGLTYRRKLSSGMGFIFKKMWIRSAELYILAIATTLIYSYWALKSGHLYIKDDALAIGQSWSQIIGNTVSLKYSFGWADFLSHFAVYMFFAPFAFLALAKKQWALVLLASWLVWINRGLSFTAAWQIIFFAGMVIGFNWHAITNFWQLQSDKTRLRVKAVLYPIAILTFAASYASTYLLFILNEHFSSLPLKLQSYVLSWNYANDWVWQYFQKWTMEPGRIVLFFIWFSALFALVLRYQTKIDTSTRGIIKMIGQNSLFVYLAHSFVVFVFKFFAPKPINLILNFLLTSLAIVVLIGLTYTYASRRFVWQAIKQSSLQQLPKIKNFRIITNLW